MIGEAIGLLRGEWVACPRCTAADPQTTGNVHIEACEVDQLGKVALVTHDEVKQFMRDAEYVRGSIVRIVFHCEGWQNGISHRFAWRFQFHKGDVFVGLEHLGEHVVTGESGYGWPNGALKRD